MVHYILAQESKFVPREERGAGLQGNKALPVQHMISLTNGYAEVWKAAIHWPDQSKQPHMTEVYTHITQ